MSENKLYKYEHDIDLHFLCSASADEPELIKDSIKYAITTKISYMIYERNFMPLNDILDSLSGYGLTSELQLVPYVVRKENLDSDTVVISHNYETNTDTLIIRHLSLIEGGVL